MSRHATHQDDELVATKGWDSRLLLRLLGWARPHAPQFGLSLAVLVALFAVQLAGPYLWRLALDGPVREVTEGSADRGEALEHLNKLVAAFASIVVLQGVLSYLEVAQLARCGQRVIHDLRKSLFEHTCRLDLSFFDERPTGSLVTRVTTDVENLSELFTSGLVVLLFDVFKVLALIAILFWIDFELAVVVAALTPILVLVSIAFRGGARHGYRLVRARLARLNGYLQEVLSGIRVVQLFGREGLVSRRFDALLEPYLEANLRTLKLFALFFPAISLVVYLIQGAALRVGGVQISAGEIDIGLFFQFWFYLALLVNPVRELGERYNVLQAAFASAERVFKVLDTEPNIAAPTGSAVADPAAAGPTDDLVRFENVSFEYVEGTPVLRDVSFEIPAGQTIAIVGPTGTGKSTVVNLLQRFHDPTAGRVLFDGRDLRELDPRALRGGCGLVLQDEFLFEGTVRENLIMGREEVDQESLERALEMSCAADVVARLPGGLDEVLHERGAQLSTGERQLLSIARALAGDPRLVILDEATASVDSGTEARIEKATRNLLAGRSALVIAHRLSTIQRADRILVLHHGRVHESGTHAELLEHGELYSRLYDLQFLDDT
jgi:ATP-binding cassette subfamily B multidrug efflux pump